MKAIADIKLAPSILAADFTRLGDQVAEVERAGADRIHVDIMDGHFVPNISMGAPVVQSLRKVTSLRLEIHMMITDHLHRTVQRVKALQKQVGVAINPATPAFVLEEILPDLDQVSGDDGQSRLRTSAFHLHDAAKDKTCEPDDRAAKTRMRIRS